MSVSTYIKSVVGGLVIMVGGPALIWYVTPDETELFKKYNPDLQRRSLEGREDRIREHDEFVARMKEYSKSDKPIWTVWKEAGNATRQRQLELEAREKQEKTRIADEIRKSMLEGK